MRHPDGCASGRGRLNSGGGLLPRELVGRDILRSPRKRFNIQQDRERDFCVPREGPLATGRFVLRAADGEDFIDDVGEAPPGRSRTGRRGSVGGSLGTRAKAQNG